MSATYRTHLGLETNLPKRRRGRSPSDLFILDRRVTQRPTPKRKNQDEEGDLEED